MVDTAPPPPELLSKIRTPRFNVSIKTERSLPAQLVLWLAVSSPVLGQFEAVRLEGMQSKFIDGRLSEESTRVEVWAEGDFFVFLSGSGYNEWDGDLKTVPISHQYFAHYYEGQSGVLRTYRVLPQFLGKHVLVVTVPIDEVKKHFDYDENDPNQYASNFGVDAVGEIQSDILSRFLCSPDGWFSDVDLPAELDEDSGSLTDRGFEVELAGEKVTANFSSATDEGMTRQIETLTRLYTKGDEIYGTLIPADWVESARSTWTFVWDEAVLRSIAFQEEIVSPSGDVRLNESELIVDVFEAGSAGEIAKPLRNIVPPDGSHINLLEHPAVHAEWRDGEIVVSIEHPQQAKGFDAVRPINLRGKSARPAFAAGREEQFRQAGRPLPDRLPNGRRLRTW